MALVFKDGEWADDPSIEEDKPIFCFRLKDKVIAHEICEYLEDTAYSYHVSDGRHVITLPDHHQYLRVLNHFYDRIVG